MREIFVNIDGQWSFIGSPEKSNGYGIIILGGSKSYVTKDNSDWHEDENKNRLCKALISEGFTIGYTNAHGMSFGNDNALQDVINIHELMIKETGINSRINLFVLSMGGLLALRLMENVDFVRSVVFSQPLLNVNKQREYENNLIKQQNLEISDPLGNAIASTHGVDYITVKQYIDKTFSLEKIAKNPIPCKIWHGTGDENVPVEINAMVFAEIRIKHNLQIALDIGGGTGHDQEGACYADHQGIIDFFKKYQ